MTIGTRGEGIAWGVQWYPHLTTAGARPVRFPGAEDIPLGFATLDNLPGMVWAQMIATWTMMEAANQDQ